MSRANQALDTAAAVAVLALLVLAAAAAPASALAARVSYAAVPLACVLLPWWSLRRSGESWGAVGVSTETAAAGAFTGLAASVVLLVPYFLAFALWFGMPAWPWIAASKARAWAAMALHQFAAVALPEEVFFRGFLQSRLNRALGRPWRILGAPAGWGLPVTAVVFTAFHLVQGIHLWTAGIIAPALVFGWLRERSDSVTAPAVFHALSNIALFTLQGGYA